MRLTFMGAAFSPVVGTILHTTDSTPGVRRCYFVPPPMGQLQQRGDCLHVPYNTVQPRVEEAAYAMDIVEQKEAVRKYRFTVEEFHKMGEAGIFSEDDRVELIDGEVLEMSPIGWRHIWCVRQLIRILVRFADERTARGEHYEADVQDPILLDGYGEPQPDLVLLKDSPIGRLPGPGEVALVVEVADTSLAFDRNVKLARYAEAGIPETWLADLIADRFEVHSEPGLDGYRKTMRYARGERVESATLPDLAFDTDEVLPPKAPEA